MPPKKAATTKTESPPRRKVGRPRKTDIPVEGIAEHNIIMSIGS